MKVYKIIGTFRNYNTNETYTYVFMNDTKSQTEQALRNYEKRTKHTELIKIEYIGFV